MSKGQALVYGAFGARGTGKTGWVVQLLQRHIRPSRLIVWDFKHDPKLRAVGEPVSDLPTLARRMQAPTFQLRYLVAHDKDIAAQFDLFCRMAWAAGGLVMFVDELAEVTKSNRAPASWRKCVNIGREYQGANGRDTWLGIIGASQRTAEVDKSFLQNCDVIHVGRCSHANDAKELAGAWGIDWRELAQLPDLHFIERHQHQGGRLVHGVLSFSRDGPAPAAKKTRTRRQTA
jgi:hypothetical protein